MPCRSAEVTIVGEVSFDLMTMLSRLSIQIAAELAKRSLRSFRKKLQQTGDANTASGLRDRFFMREAYRWAYAITLNKESISLSQGMSHMKPNDWI